MKPTPLQSKKHELFKDVPKYIQTKADIKKRKERKRLREQNLRNHSYKRVFTADEIKKTKID